MNQEKNEGKIPVTFNGRTIYAYPTTEGLTRAEAILREEQGVRISDFVDSLSKEELESLSLNCQKVMMSSIWQDSTYTDEELQESWNLFSRVESRLKTISRT